ncbi:hypothetical protein PFLmoz3_00085 [Pseudomonas fluorescens]|uniref:Uncharacterized protein n=1 Tax=Pseudomonas fluorescens TaxID=294 RepID=A0A120G9A7_PSEFL|nr:hypothetical protein PFLmoz3_00085 [Pseudomonas fluorescens]
MKDTRPALPLSLSTHSMATLLPSAASNLRTSSAGGSTPASRFCTLNTVGLSARRISSWNEYAAPVTPIKASTSPAVMPKNQCNWNRVFFNTSERLA